MNVKICKVTQDRSRSLEMAPFDRSHTNSYSSSVVATTEDEYEFGRTLMYRFRNKTRYLSKNANFLYPFHYQIIT